MKAFGLPLLLAVFLVSTSCRSRNQENDVTHVSRFSQPCPQSAAEKCKSLAGGQTQCRLLADKPGAEPACFYPVDINGPSSLVYSHELKIYVQMPTPGEAPLAPVAPSQSKLLTTCLQVKADIGCDAYCQTKWQDCWILQYPDQTICQKSCAAGK